MKSLLLTLVLLLACALFLKAQDYSVTALDVPQMDRDSVRTRPQISPLLLNPLSSTLGLPLFHSMEFPFETKEQRAARINAMISASVSGSVSEYLRWYRPPKLSQGQKMALFVARLFLTPPVNPSIPPIFSQTPGPAPFEHPFSPDRFPQLIRTEYDAASGTYKQVMVPWNEFQLNLNQSYGAYRTDPVPKVYFTSGDRQVH